MILKSIVTYVFNESKVCKLPYNIKKLRLDVGESIYGHIEFKNKEDYVANKIKNIEIELFNEYNCSSYNYIWNIKLFPTENDTIFNFKTKSVCMGCIKQLSFQNY